MLGHFEVIFVGAGMSGIGGAHHFLQKTGSRNFLILDEQVDYGGTWRTHKYPGIRSDSELYTFGYSFKPWKGAPIATAKEILDYLGGVIEEADLSAHFRFQHRILKACWNTRLKQWELEGVRAHTGQPFQVTTSFLWMGQGYYRHDEGYTPTWPKMHTFQGQIIHPQRWPEGLNLKGKRVVVIGSGATAATLIPSIAGESAHTTMVQRSPTYFMTGRNVNELADLLRDLKVPDEWTHEIVRRKLLKDQRNTVRRAFDEPEALKKELLNGVRQHLGDDALVQKHFTPSYPPWRQRVAFIPNGDLFSSIKNGHASVVTGQIEEFQVDGIKMKSGEVIEADIVVTATGLNLNVMGDIGFYVDGEPVDFSSTVSYRGMMFTGVPNLLWVFGYFRASWTLRVDLIGEFFCRILQHMRTKGASQVTPALRPEDSGMELLPWVESSNFNPGYLARSIDKLPKQGSQAPWRHTQDYWLDSEDMPKAELDDGALAFT